MSTRIIRYSPKPRQGLLQVCADWQLTTAISVTTLILALNISFPNLSDHAGQPLSTYQTRLPTIQYRNPIPKFIYLSYLNPSTGDYLKGNDDIFYVAFWVLVWSSLREILIRMVWKPVGRFCGIDDRHKLQRFAEQGWNLAYYTTFWCMGIKILSTFPSPILSLNIRQYWEGYPQDTLPGFTKFYYLLQIAFWFQQLIVINLEKPRKDYLHMLAHHIVTVVLISASYSANLTGIGIAIHATMDVSDILLSIAKMLNYMGGGLACDGTFSLFVLSWIYTRHYIFVKIIYAIYHQLPQDIILPKEVIDGYISRYNLWRSFLVLLSFLQCLLIFWLITILRVMWNVVMGYGADDDRSDSGDSDMESDDTRQRTESALRFSEKGGLLDSVEYSDESRPSSTAPEEEKAFEDRGTSSSLYQRKS